MRASDIHRSSTTHGFFPHNQHQHLTVVFTMLPFSLLSNATGSQHTLPPSLLQPWPGPCGNRRLVEIDTQVVMTKPAAVATHWYPKYSLSATFLPVSARLMPGLEIPTRPDPQMHLWADYSAPRFAEHARMCTARARAAERRLQFIVSRYGAPSISASHLQEAIVSSALMHGAEVTWRGQKTMKKSFKGASTE